MPNPALTGKIRDLSLPSGLFERGFGDCEHTKLTNRSGAELKETSSEIGGIRLDGPWPFPKAR